MVGDGEVAPAVTPRAKEKKINGRRIDYGNYAVSDGMTMAEKTVNACVIIVEVELGGEKVVMGALADAVQEVHQFLVKPGKFIQRPFKYLQKQYDF